MKKSKFLALFLILALIFPFSAGVFAIDLPDSGDFSGKLVILHTNDTHGRDLSGVYTTAAVAQMKKDYVNAGADVLLLSAGDAAQGTPLVNLSQGAAAIAFMNAAGYDAMSPGNHEFDWGVENLRKLAAEAAFPFLSANIIDSATGTPLFDAREIISVGDRKVGLVGIDTPETATSAHPDKMKGISFLAGEALYTAVQKEVDALKSAGCDPIIALGHMGDADASADAGNRSIDLLENVSGIDLFIDGHSHTEIDGGLKTGDTLRVSTGEYLNHIGVVVYDGAAFTAGLLNEGDYAGTDPGVLKLLTDTDAETDEALSAVIGRTEVILDGNREPGVRTQETNLGDFAADAILWGANDWLGDGAADVALTNGGSIRESVQIGDISMKTMNTVFPFGNEITTVGVTGAELLEALEAATCAAPEAIGAFPQVAGMSFSLHTDYAYEKGAQYPGDSVYCAPAKPGLRVRDLKIGGEPVDPDRTYIVATNDFTAAGGDTYGVFLGKPVLKTGLTLDDALTGYMKTVLNGVITAEKYGKPAGRIRIEAAPFSDTKSGSWYYGAVMTAYDAGLFAGTGDGKFTPNGTMTRGMLVTALGRMSGADIGAVSADAGFKDVSGDRYYAPYAAWARENGVMTGDDGYFHPDRAVTRQELAAILLRYAEYAGKGPAGAWAIRLGYADTAEIADWAVEGAMWCSMKEIITGRPGNLFDPAASATRAEVAAVLVRFEALPAA
jgi:2',3'-cyclic-nucleotide 2'-phosphodiesterase (5'-nucleotidase family)